MSSVYESIDDRLRGWIERQHLFFVATAPSGSEGLVNCSPKGLSLLAILGPTTVAWADIGGSGIETVAHLKDNGRIVIMFCALEGPPRIVRLHGRGRVVEPRDADFDALRARFPDAPVCRSVIEVELTRISDSCGYGVPLYEYRGERPSMRNYIEGKDPGQIEAYFADMNAESLDGLPGLDLTKR